MSGIGRAVAAILLAGAVAGAAAFAHLLASEPNLPAFGASALPSAPGSPLVVQAAPWAPERSAVAAHPGRLAVGPAARTIVIARLEPPATATHAARAQPAHVATGTFATPAATRPRSTKPSAIKPAAPAPAVAPAPVPVAPTPVAPAPTVQAPAAPSDGKHRGDGEQHAGQDSHEKHGGDHGDHGDHGGNSGNSGNSGNKGDSNDHTVLAALQIVSPTPPEVVAPTPPQVVAPQPPQVVVPTPPQVVAPTPPQVVAPQLPSFGGTSADGGGRHDRGHGDAGGDGSD